LQLIAGPLEILYEDNHCLAISKPGGAVSAHFQGAEVTLDHAAKEYLKEKYHKPGRVFLGIVHRLDRPVSGVLLFARTSKAAARLAKQFREGTVEKVYWAVVAGRVAPPTGILENYLKKDLVSRRMAVVKAETAGSRLAVARYQERGYCDDRSWLELRPQTGRTHQLRVQLAHCGYPIYGDRKYGSLWRFAHAIALHARSLTFQHPVRHEPITLIAGLPATWQAQFAPLFREALP
jgi:23S rRNA pseudouridine1911/1915/1917 synthase